MQGSTRRTCRVVSSRAKWNLGLCWLGFALKIHEISEKTAKNYWDYFFACTLYICITTIREIASSHVSLHLHAICCSLTMFFVS